VNKASTGRAALSSLYTDDMALFASIRECSERFYWPADAANHLPLKTDCCAGLRGLWERRSGQAASAMKYFRGDVTLADGTCLGVAFISVEA